MNSTKPLLTTLALAFALGATTLHAQHGHLNAGATSAAQDAQLNFANGSIFAAASGYVKQLDFTNGNTYAGFFQGNITFTALPATVAFGGPTLGAPALGSFIKVQMVSMMGPAGSARTFLPWPA